VLAEFALERQPEAGRQERNASRRVLRTPARPRTATSAGC